MTSVFRQVGNFQVAGWSVSGCETCVVVQREGFQICFDIGFAIEEAVQCDVVFISHGHIDHIAALPQHARKRELMRVPPAKYYMPSEVVEPMRKICKLYAEMHGEGAESLNKLELIPVEPGRKIQLSKGRSVEAFATVHRITSLGFIVRRRQMKRSMAQSRPESASASGETAESEDVFAPEIAYLGDTAFSVFLNPPVADLLAVELLITEATYLDRPEDRGPSNPGLVTRAREYGHTHLLEFARHERLFERVGHIYLIHFSKRYTPSYICRLLNQNLSRQLRSRVVPATLARDCMEMYARQYPY